MDMILNFMQSAAGYLVPFLTLTIVIVFIHEMGHFLTARYFGVTVEVFSIGFGPELLHWNDRYNTRWRIALIPLGGYVKFVGDADASSKPDPEAVVDSGAVTLNSRPLSQRAWIVAAGPLANFILTILLLAGTAYFVGSEHLVPRIESVLPDQPADKAGMKPGDIIISIDNTPVMDFAEVQGIISANAGRSLNVVVDRGGREIPLIVTPSSMKRSGLMSAFPLGRIGITVLPKAENFTKLEYGPLEAIGYGVKQTYTMAVLNIQGIATLIVGSGSINDIAGPVTIAEISKKTADAGLSSFVLWVAGISLAIGVVNLLPIPILDGGHLLFYGIEGMLKRPIDPATMSVCYRIGMFVVLGLMGLGLFSDGLRWGRILNIF
ncbi:MAG: RIP metalloprotease RseP [Rhizobiales bacterium]|nr:RIP metalloprotease RseP [Hyphomicrobiales bacterium]